MRRKLSIVAGIVGLVVALGIGSALLEKRARVEAAAVQATAAVQAAALQATGSLNQQAIINWLHKPTTIVQTVTGPVQFDGDGKNKLIANSALIFQWQPGQGGSGAPQFVQVLPTGIGTKPIIPWAG